MFRFITGSSHAGAGRRRNPSFRRVWVHMTEPIQRVLNPGVSGEGAGGDIQHPGIGRANVGEDELVVDR